MNTGKGCQAPPDLVHSRERGFSLVFPSSLVCLRKKPETFYSYRSGERSPGIPGLKLPSLTQPFLKTYRQTLPPAPGPKMGDHELGLRSSEGTVTAWGKTRESGPSLHDPDPLFGAYALQSSHTGLQSQTLKVSLSLPTPPPHALASATRELRTPAATRQR